MEIINLINEYDAATVVVIIIMAVIAMKEIIEFCRWGKTQLDGYHSNRTKADSIEERLAKLEKHDAWQYETLKNVIERINECNEKLTDLTHWSNESKQKEHNVRISTLKNNIAHIYRHAHSENKISVVQKELLEELIEEYQTYSSNSFVHDVVIPEIPLWEVI